MACLLPGMAASDLVSHWDQGLMGEGREQMYESELGTAVVLWELLLPLASLQPPSAPHTLQSEPERQARQA